MFTKKPKLSKTQLLDQKSENAIFVFKSTLNSLLEVEKELIEEVEYQEEKIKEINLEIKKLENRQQTNNKFINKLKEFFE